ncbi:MAG: hypothetical protein GY817_03875 [bacterium]|nr:hypothetical protein [bacterium]
MISIFLGSISAILGFVSLVVGWQYFLEVIYGTLPVSLFVAGVIAIIAGIAGLKDHKNSKKDEEKLNNG